MHEDKTHAIILDDLLKETPSDVQKIPGSLVYNALSALAYEMEKLYIQADYIIDQGYADSADYESLKKMAADRGIYPEEATCASFRAEFNVAIPSGARFNLKQYNYIVSDLLDPDAHAYLAVCETPGSQPNGLLGELTPITFVEGLESAELTELLVAGSDAEKEDAFLERYKASYQYDSYGGNISAYEEFFSSQPGIADSKVYPAWNGAHTVKGVLIGSNFKAPSEYLISQISQACDPDPGKGYGFAPIGHAVTVVAVEEVTVDVGTNISFSNGYSFETSKEAIEGAIEQYFDSIRKTWADNENLTVYISRLESAILDVQGVIDVSGTVLNGSGSNLALEADQIPVLGEVTNT